MAVKDRRAALAALEHDEKALAGDMATLEKREDRLADAVVDGTLGKDAAKRKRLQLDRDRTSMERRQVEFAARRATLERDAEHVERVDETRTRLRKVFGNWPRLLKMTDDEKRDLLRTLLPPDGNAGILVGVYGPEDVNPRDPDSPVGEMFVEIKGLLPVEQAVIKSAVLGGALAVP